MDKRHWQETPLSLEYGNIIQHVIFEKEGTSETDPEGAILRYIDRFAHGTLEPGVSTRTEQNEQTQTVFFVSSGEGILGCNHEKRRIAEGDGILIPPGVAHSFSNEGSEPLHLLSAKEAAPNGPSTGNQDAIIRNYRDSELLTSHWHYLVHPIFGEADGLISMRDVLVVRLDPMTTGDNHGHGPNMDEVWYMWQGQCVHVVSREVCVQRQGTAVSVCPSDPGHSLINHTDQPAYLFYFCSKDLNT